MRKEKCARNDVFNNVLTVIKVIYQKKKKIKLTNELIANDLYCSQSSLCEYRKIRVTYPMNLLIKWYGIIRSYILMLRMKLKHY